MFFEIIYIWQDCSYNALKVPAEQLSRGEKKKEYVLLGLFNYFFLMRDRITYSAGWPPTCYTAMWQRLINLNSLFHLYLPSAGIEDMHHHALHQLRFSIHIILAFLCSGEENSI